MRNSITANNQSFTQKNNVGQQKLAHQDFLTTIVTVTGKETVCMLTADNQSVKTPLGLSTLIQLRRTGKLI